MSQVLGLEALRTREASAQHRLLIEHINKLRTIDELRGAQIVLGLESNLGCALPRSVRCLRHTKITDA